MYIGRTSVNLGIQDIRSVLRVGTSDKYAYDFGITFPLSCDNLAESIRIIEAELQQIYFKISSLGMYVTKDKTKIIRLGSNSSIDTLQLDHVSYAIDSS